MTQEYTGNNIAEILMISYDGEENTEIESFNNTINFGIQQIYYNFIESADSDSWIEIRSYPFSSDNYLQIVTTCCTYPNYGTDGDLYSYNFDLKENRFLSIDDILEDLQLDRDSIADTVRGLLEDENNDGATAKDVNVAGFLIIQGPSDPLIQLLLQVELEAPGGDPWNSFFGYTPELGELLPLNSECLFDPSDIDQMDPPLSYQTDILPYSFTPEIAIDTSGLEELTLGCEYMFGGMVYYTIEELTPVAYSEDDVLEQIKSLEPSEISLINITNSDEHSELLSFPCWLVVYYEGGNEDTIYCKD
ncbi:MAG TPA: hypothetical protein VJZ01_02200, partial [Lachnospiraceae bacterium]|nr:hypothetical protein [Lachnospiraceae bacterium]